MVSVVAAGRLKLVCNGARRCPLRSPNEGGTESGVIEDISPTRIVLTAVSSSASPFEGQEKEVINGEMIIEGASAHQRHRRIIPSSIEQQEKIKEGREEKRDISEWGEGS
jgi:hypothetical protein